MANILVIDDEESIRFTFEHFLREAGHEAVCAGTYEEALAHVSEMPCDVIFSDIILERKTGVDLLRQLRGRNLTCPVIMITGYPAFETAYDAFRLGAFDYLTKPIEPAMLLHVTELALQYKRAADEKEEYRSRLDTIFSSVEDSITTIDKNWVVTEINEAAKNICGFDRESIGKSMKSLELGCEGKCLEALKQTIKTGQSVKARRFECRRDKNSPKIVNLSTYPLIDRRDGFTGAAMVIRDETRVGNLECDLGERQHLHHMLGKSRQIQKIYSMIEVLANVDSSVLITGESGTGKELAAEAMHYLGARKNKPLVKVNCSALTESLLESELFGHVKGAFTGAVHEKVGRFQKADGGTIFLDEIGDLSLKVQATLLRVLQEKQFERVGDSTPVRVDARIIAATNKNLEEKVKLGEFRADLLFRLRVVEVVLPPLRERHGDIPLLVEHFLKAFNRKMNTRIEALSSEVERIFLDYPWPGNIRELQYTLEHAFVLCADRTIISVDHLPAHIREVGSANASPIHVSCSGATKDGKAAAIVQALEKTAWNKKRAARLLGIDRKTLYRNIAKYNIATLKKMLVTLTPICSDILEMFGLTMS
jgi:two-component system, NtrC family, response regulator HydG